MNNKYILRALHRFCPWTGLCIVLAISLIIVLADHGSLPLSITQLYAFPLGDKIGHFVLVGLFALGLILLFSYQLDEDFSPHILPGSQITIFLVTVEEISQLALKSRSFSMMDLFFSYLGIATTEILIRWWKHHQDGRDLS